MTEAFEQYKCYRFIFPEQPKLSYTFKINGFVGPMQSIIDGKLHTCTAVYPSSTSDYCFLVSFDGCTFLYMWDIRDFVEDGNILDWAATNLTWDYYADTLTTVNMRPNFCSSNSSGIFLGDEVIAKVKISSGVIFTYGILKGINDRGEFIIKPLMNPYKGITEYFTKDIRKPTTHLKALADTYISTEREMDNVYEDLNLASENLHNEIKSKFDRG